MIEDKFLEKLIKDPSLIAKQEFEMISEILDKAKNIFSKENLLLEFDVEEDKEIYVLGDIHGNLDTLLKFIDIINEKKPNLIISLGDIPSLLRVAITFPTTALELAFPLNCTAF